MRKRNKTEQRNVNPLEQESIAWLLRYNLEFGPLRYGDHNQFVLTVQFIHDLYEAGRLIGIENPITLNQKNIFGNFAIKPALADWFTTYHNYVFNRQGAYEGRFCGYHWGSNEDTRLATNLEFLSAFGINLISGFNLSLEEAFQTAVYKNKRGKDKISNEELIRTFCFDHVEQARRIASTLLTYVKLQPNNGYTAAKNYKGQLNNDFMVAGNYDSSRSLVESKADISVYKGDDCKARISIKMDKYSQGCSMQPKELLGIVSTMGLSDECLERFRALCSSLYTYTGIAKEQPKQQKINRKTKQLQDDIKLNQIFLDYPDVHRNLIYQVLTGECKFGKDAGETAQTMCIISRDMSQTDVMNINDFIDENIDCIKFSFTPKSSNEKGYESLRMYMVHNF